MPTIRTTRTTVPDHDGTPIQLPYGTLTFETKSGTTTSKVTYNAGQQPHRTWPLRAKHRTR